MDSNVVGYLVMGTEPFAREVRKFWSAVAEKTAPVQWEAEVANVVWMAVRSGVLSSAEGSTRLTLAAGLNIESVPNRLLWQGALSRSVASGVAVYDTLFVELAARERLPLATFDKAVLQAFPEIARRPADLM